MSTRFYNVKSAAIGATSITTIASVEIRQSTQMLEDRGDNDAFTSWAARGRTSTDVTINLKDPAQIAALAALSGDLVFNGVPESGGTEKVVTVEGVILGSPNYSAPHGAPWSGSVSGIAIAADGGNPVTIDDAA